MKGIKMHVNDPRVAEYTAELIELITDGSERDMYDRAKIDELFENVHVRDGLMVQAIKDESEEEFVSMLLQYIDSADDASPLAPAATVASILAYLAGNDDLSKMLLGVAITNNEHYSLAGLFVRIMQTCDANTTRLLILDSQKMIG